MKFKTLALAAMMAASAPAFAEIVTNSFSFDPADFGKAEYVFIATNAAGSYVQDLGVSANDIAALGAGMSFTQAVGGAQWDKFVAFGGSNTQWAIIAAQPIATGFAPFEVNAWTTRNVNQPLGVIQTSQHNDGTNNIAVWFQKSDLASNPSVDNNRYATAVGTDAYFDNGLTSFNSYFNARNAIGTQSEIIFHTSRSEVSDAPALFTVQSTVANFDGTTITLTSPIPEPSSYALLLAGLGAIGFLARRRSV